MPMTDDERDERREELGSGEPDISIVGSGTVEGFGGQEYVSGEGRPVERGESAKGPKSGSLIPERKAGWPPVTFKQLFSEATNFKTTRNELLKGGQGARQFEEAMLRSAASGISSAIRLVFAACCIAANKISSGNKNAESLPGEMPADKNFSSPVTDEKLGQAKEKPPQLTVAEEHKKNKNKDVPPLINATAKSTKDVPPLLSDNSAQTIDNSMPPSAFSAIGVPEIKGVSASLKNNDPVRPQPVFVSALASGNIVKGGGRGGAGS